MLNTFHFSVLPAKVTDPALQRACWFLLNPLGRDYDLECSDALLPFLWSLPPTTEMLLSDADVYSFKLVNLPVRCR